MEAQKRVITEVIVKESATSKVSPYVIPGLISEAKSRKEATGSVGKILYKFIKNTLILF